MNNLKETEEQVLPPKVRRKKEIPYFLRTLHQILQNESFVELIGWSEEGDGILLKKSEEFASQVLPQFFKHKSLSSFIRQLNMYNFKKERISNTLAVYKHVFFKRGQEPLLKMIRRKKVNKVPLKVSERVKKHEKPEKSVATQEEEGPQLVVTNKKIKESCEGMLREIENLELKVNMLSTSNMQLEQQIQMYEQLFNQRSMYNPARNLPIFNQLGARGTFPPMMNFPPNGNPARFGNM